MPVPSYEEMMQPAMLALADSTQKKNKEIQEAVAHRLGLSEADRAELLPSGKQALYKSRVNWAITYLINAGLVDKVSRGVFRISQRGTAALQNPAAHIDNRYLMQYESFRRFVGKDTGGERPAPCDDLAKPDADTPEDQIENAIAIINNGLSENLLSEIRAQSPAFFEHLVVKLLVAMGYGGPEADSARVVGRSGDEGIDGIIKSDKLGFDSIYIQAKRYDSGNAVSNREIRNFSGALLQKGASKGVFITTSSFSPHAVRAVKEIKAQQIILIDGEMLARLMIEYNIGVTVERTVCIKKLDTDFFNTDG